MREILFKAKRKDNGEWVEGYYVKTGEASYIVVPYSQADISGAEGSNIEVDADTICQYTGLKDFNGKKIFENDIIRLYDMTEEDYMTGWSETMGAFVICNVNTRAEHIDLVGDVIDDVPMTCVVGNIFES